MVTRDGTISTGPATSAGKLRNALDMRQITKSSFMNSNRTLPERKVKAVVQNPHNYLERINEKGVPAINRCKACGQEGPTAEIMATECTAVATPTSQRRDLLDAIDPAK